jgi:hypothetical protein
MEALISPIYLKVLRNLRLGLAEAYYKTGVIDAEEEDGKPWRVTVASLADIAAEDEPAMSLDLEGWMSSKCKG